MGICFAKQRSYKFSWGNIVAELTQEILKSCVIYNPDTGIFISAKSVRGHAKHKALGWVNKEWGYIDISVLYKVYKAHRLAWLYMTGELPENQIDHINHIKTDNRFCNLRSVTQFENMKNCPLQKNNTSGFVGVYRYSPKPAWNTQISCNGKKYMKLFTDKMFGCKNLSFMAACLYVANKRIEFGFHENHGISK